MRNVPPSCIMTRNNVHRVSCHCCCCQDRPLIPARTFCLSSASTVTVRHDVARTLATSCTEFHRHRCSICYVALIYSGQWLPDHMHGGGPPPAADVDGSCLGRAAHLQRIHCCCPAWWQKGPWHRIATEVGALSEKAAQHLQYRAPTPLAACKIELLNCALHHDVQNGKRNNGVYGSRLSNMRKQACV